MLSKNFISNSQRSKNNCETLNAIGGTGANNMAKATMLRTKKYIQKVLTQNRDKKKRTGK